ncbi:DUF4340 domain-containing protein [bacterium]|nr:DUF4340 domain-containing protein [bacterium]
MKARSTWMLLMVCVAAAAAVYFLEIRGGARRSEQAERDGRLISSDAHRIRRLTILRPAEASGSATETLTVERDGESWRILSPVVSPGDNTALESLVSAIHRAKTERAMEGIEDWAAYGLEPPGLTVFVVPDEGLTDTLLIGDVNPTGAFIYVRRPGQDRAVLTDASLRSSLVRPLYELRDRSVLSFEKEEVRRVEIRRPAGLLVIEKEEGGWEIRKPVDAPAAPAPVDELLNRIRWAEIKSFVDDFPVSRSGHGLNPPGIRLTVTAGPDSVRKSLRFGTRRNGRVYAADAARPSVFLVDTGLVNALLKRADDFRETKIAPFDEWRVKRVEIRSASSATVAFRKDSAGVWVFDPPAPEQPEGERVEVLLTALASLEAETFIARNPDRLSRYGLEPAGREVILEGEDGEPVARIGFGKARNSRTLFLINRSTRWVAAAHNDILKHLTPSRNAWTAENDSAHHPAPSGPSGAGGKTNKKP